MQTSLNLDQLPIDEKFMILEQIWENLSANATAQGFSPKWYMDILAERERSVEEGSATFHDISKVKKRLQKLTNENRRLENVNHSKRF